MLNLLRKSGEGKAEGRHLHDALVSRARAPVFFTDFAIADTLDGRFDVLVLHAWLMLAVLGAKGAAQAAQDLTDTIFVGFDAAMREQGAGDMGLSRKMKAFADAFYGRLAAYEAAKTGEALSAAFARNLWRGAGDMRHATALAAYAHEARARLMQSLPEGADFGPLPVLSESSAAP